MSIIFLCSMNTFPLAMSMRPRPMRGMHPIRNPAPFVPSVSAAASMIHGSPQWTFKRHIIQPNMSLGNIPATGGLSGIPPPTGLPLPNAGVSGLGQQPAAGVLAVGPSNNNMAHLFEVDMGKYEL